MIKGSREAAGVSSAWRHARVIMMAFVGVALLGSARSWADEKAAAVPSRGLVSSNQGVSLDSDVPGAIDDAIDERIGERADERIGEGGGESTGGDALGSAASSAPLGGANVSGEGVVSGSESETRIIRSRPGRVAGGEVVVRTPSWYSRGFVPLGVVLALMGSAYYLVRRFMPSRRLSDDSLLRVVGRTNITPKHSIALIQLSRRFVLVGLSGDRIEALSDIVDPSEVADLTARIAGQHAATSTRFEELLVSESEEYTGPLEEDSPRAHRLRERVGDASGQLSSLLSRLRTLQSK